MGSAIGAAAWAPPSARVMLLSRSPVAQQNVANAVGTADGECVTIADAAAAFQLLAQSPPDLALLDAEALWAAELEGGKLVAELTNKGVPTVLLVSTSTPAELLESACQVGLTDCIILPLRANHLRDRIAALRAATRAVQPVRVLTQERSDFAERLTEQLVLHGYRVRLEAGKAEMTAPEPGSLSVVICDEPACLVHALGSSSEMAIAVTSLPRPYSLPGGTLAWLSRSAMTPAKVVAQVHSQLKLPCRSLLAEASIPFFCPVEFREWGTGKDCEWSTGYSFQLSAGGLFVRTLVPARKKVALELRLHLTTTSEQIPATGVTAWSNCWPGGEGTVLVGMGVEFLGMPLSKRLLHLIQACRGDANE